MTSHADMDVSGKKTGNWFAELATLYYGFLATAFQVVLSSPRGGSAPIDQRSGPSPFWTANAARFREDRRRCRAEGNGKPEHTRLPLFVSGRLRATVGPGE